MRTYKKGISLIVLVITVIVLAILATTVIISLSNTNIISEASKTVFKSDMASYKELYSFYLADKLMEDATFNSSTLNVTSDDAEFTKIFGDNVKDAYKEKLQVVNGKLVYKTLDATETEILENIGMAVTLTPVSEVKIGALVAYTPTVDPTASYEGATYILDEDEESDTYDTYIESTTEYVPEKLKWVYLGQDENGNILLTSQESTNFKVTIAGQDGFVNGPERLDTLCNTLYGNSVYASTTRNMKIEDVNRVLGYTGPKGSYYNFGAEEISTDEAMTFGEMETMEGVTLYDREIPRLSTTEFEDYLSDAYNYTGTTYKGETTDEYKVIFKKADGTTIQSTYWLSSPAGMVEVGGFCAHFSVRYVTGGYVSTNDVFYSYNSESGNSFALRPVIELKSNIHFGEKNADGELTLVEM